MIPASKSVLTAQSIFRILDHQPIILSLSKYSNCIFIVINQTGTVGSIIRGQLTDTSQLINQDTLESIQEKIYDIKVLFGSTQIQFYQILMRKILQIVLEGHKLSPTYKIIGNFSLRCTSPHFQSQLYYKQIQTHFNQLITQIL